MGNHYSFKRALRVAGYSWPLYAGAAFGATLGTLLAVIPGMPSPLRWLGGIGGIVAAWYGIASFAAFDLIKARPRYLENG